MGCRSQGSAEWSGESSTPEEASALGAGRKEKEGPWRHPPGGGMDINSTRLGRALLRKVGVDSWDSSPMHLTFVSEMIQHLLPSDESVRDDSELKPGVS